VIAFFDLDDTLCDRAAAFSHWLSGFCATHGLDEESVRTQILEYDQRGLRPREEFFGLVRDQFGLAASVDELVAAYHPAYTALYRLDPAVGQGIRDLQSDGWTVGIVTNGKHWQRDKLRTTGLDSIVDGWAISDLERVAKPYPEIFRKAALNCGSTIDDAVWMVGDNPVADIGGAVLTGLRSIWIDLGRDWTEPAFKPDVVCDGPLGAIEVIRNS
jgi:putative hydrolase of the HAD superfamily